MVVSISIKDWKSISTLFLGAAGLVDRLLANAFVEAFFLWVDFLAFPAIFLFFQIVFTCSLFSVKNLRCDEQTSCEQ